MLILTLLMGSLSNATAQDKNQTPQPIFIDSVFCLPVRYFMFIMDDLKKGDQNGIKAQELQQKIIAQGDENSRMKSQLNLEREETSMCRDTLEMKNAHIVNLRLENHKLKTGKTIWMGIAGTLAFLFLLK